MFKTKEELVMAINRCLPYSNQIKELDFTSERDSVRFTWRGDRIKVSTNCSVEEVSDGMLRSNNVCILFGELLKRQYISDYDN